MSGAVIFFMGLAAFVISAMVIVGVAAVVVFNVLGVFWGISSLLLVTCIYFSSIVWAWRDAGKRGKPGWAAALLVALCFWPFGLLMWLLFRPETGPGLTGIKTDFTSPTPPPVIS